MNKETERGVYFGVSLLTMSRVMLVGIVAVVLLMLQSSGPVNAAPYLAIDTSTSTPTRTPTTTPTMTPTVTTTTTPTITVTRTPGTATVTSTPTPTATQPSAEIAATNPTPRPLVNYNMSIFGRRFLPNSVKVPVGSTVIWTNNDRTDHRIIGITFKSSVGGRYDISPFRPQDAAVPPVAVLDSGILAKRGDPPTAGAERPAGGRYVYTFTAEGIYTFRDASLTTLAGRIVVVPLVDPPTSSGSGGGNGAPTATPVPVGGPPEKVISIFGSRFKPPIIRIPVGTTVKWRNGDRISQSFFGVRFKNSLGVTHDWSPSPSSLIPRAPFAPLEVTLDPRPAAIAGSAFRDESAPATYTFDTVGSYTYRGDNATMAGTIIVFTPR